MGAIGDFEQKSKAYAAKFPPELGKLPLPPGKKVAVITCMDGRIIPSKILGFEEGEAHVIRNAGGRASDALRSLVISQQLLGTRELIIFHHTDCEMLTFKDQDLKSKLKKEFGKDITGTKKGQVQDFLPISDLEESIKEDLEFLKNNEFVLDVPTTGYIYDVHNGVLKKVATLNDHQGSSEVGN